MEKSDILALVNYQPEVDNEINAHIHVLCQHKTMISVNFEQECVRFITIPCFLLFLLCLFLLTIKEEKKNYKKQFIKYSNRLDMRRENKSHITRTIV